MNDNNDNENPTVTQPLAATQIPPRLAIALDDAEREIHLLRAALRAGQGEAVSGFLREARAVLERLSSDLSTASAQAWNLRKSKMIVGATRTAFARELEAAVAQVVAVAMLTGELVDSLRLNPRRSAGLDATVARHLIELKKRMAVILREAEKLKGV